MRPWFGGNSGGFIGGRDPHRQSSHFRYRSCLASCPGGRFHRPWSAVFVELLKELVLSPRAKKTLATEKKSLLFQGIIIGGAKWVRGQRLTPITRPRDFTNFIGVFDALLRTESTVILLRLQPAVDQFCLSISTSRRLYPQEDLVKRTVRWSWCRSPDGQSRMNPNSADGNKQATVQDPGIGLLVHDISFSRISKKSVIPVFLRVVARTSQNKVCSPPSSTVIAKTLS
ncbi:unnamed protein product [Bursaphelenchus xylophilus]|uniref:(pine wood nematode) hypothetical protein n=1 Tax=Bursaphelenchus xylophilus TaxID=6326 RepID=A0A7I8X6H3_BURXY|nr:unnamed protein product [Bursaphelenchus xylophilus]CAG9123425.1 unnamed protein product [Bursaphelenchus xylophilus]